MTPLVCTPKEYMKRQRFNRSLVRTGVWRRVWNRPNPQNCRKKERKSWKRALLFSVPNPGMHQTLAQMRSEVLRQIAPEGSPESSAKSLSQKFFGVPSLSLTLGFTCCRYLICRNPGGPLFRSAGPKRSLKSAGQESATFLQCSFSMSQCSFSLAAAQLLVTMTSALQRFWSECCSATSAARAVLQGVAFKGCKF